MQSMTKGLLTCSSMVSMTSLLGRRYVLFNTLMTTQLFREYNSTATSEIAVSDCEINKNLLSKQNRERCLEKMRRAPTERMKTKGNKNETKLAAVLIVLCHDEKMESLSLLYTRRSHLLSRHMRQISFPGGIKEDNEDFIQCALRETQEEIGLPPNRIEIWGSGNLITPPHTAAIMPVIGVIKNMQISELKLNAAEVEDVFLIPVKRLAHPQTLRYTQFKSGFSSPVFVIDDKRIWGLTGFITNIFLNCLLPLELNKLQNRVKFIRPFKCKSL